MEISSPRDMGIIRLSGRVITDITILSILVFVYSLLLYATPVCAQKDFSALYKKVAPCVVRIDVLDIDGESKSGTGFFIREDGILVTNYHIIEDYVEAGAKLSNGEIITIERIIAENRETDLVLLKLHAKGRSFPTLKVTATKIKAGQPVVVIGSPFGLEGTISDGIISAVREIPDFGKIIQITAPISPGSSGSPVLNIKGEVVGVATAFLKEGQSLNFAISVESLTPLMLAQGSGIEGRLTAVEKAIVDLRIKIESIGKESETLGKKVEDTGKKIGVWEEHVEDWGKKVEDLGKKAQFAGKKTEDWEKNLEEWRKKVDDWGKKVEDLGKKVEYLGKKIEDLGKKPGYEEKKTENWGNKETSEVSAAIEGLHKETRQLSTAIEGLRRRVIIGSSNVIETGEGGKGGTSSTVLSVKFKTYYNLLWERIRSVWVLPEAALGGKRNLETIIAIRIAKDGQIEDIQFEKKSGNPYLDESALRAIKKANPLPPLPPGIETDKFDVGVRFTPSDL